MTLIADPQLQTLVQEAIRVLGKKRVVLAIHDQSFPGQPNSDFGRGSPYGQGARDFIRFVQNLGFNALQLGPQGETSRINISPYDGTSFSRSTLALDFEAMSESQGDWISLLSRDNLDRVIQNQPDGPSNRVKYTYVFDEHLALLQSCFDTYQQHLADNSASISALESARQTFELNNAHWLKIKQTYYILSQLHRTNDWQQWKPALEQRLFCPHSFETHNAQQRIQQVGKDNQHHAGFYNFGQFLIHEQHQRFKADMESQGMTLFGDLQIGISFQDQWAYRNLFLDGYLMGAPPSRTNPEGQPWQYPVLNPQLYRTKDAQPGSVHRFVQARLNKFLHEYNGLRVDHPHGWVDPWVYRADDEDPLHAVQNGSRLFSSPNAAGHPKLAGFAIAAETDLTADKTVPPYADEWVSQLSSQQVDAYSAMVDVIMAEAQSAGVEPENILCEVLSTQPYPLQRVMEKYAMGRFRVTQKAKTDNPQDVYRSENAQPQDWVMVGNHDTPPIWAVVKHWESTGQMPDRANYLANQLIAEPGDREAFRDKLLASPPFMVQALVADLFACRAENISIFFADLLGFEEIYNAPGTVNDINWTLRVPPTYRQDYLSHVSEDRALNMPMILALAIRARGRSVSESHRDLLADLDRYANQYRNDAG